MMESDSHTSAATSQGQGDSEKASKEVGETVQDGKKENKGKVVRQQSLERKDSWKGKTLYKHGHLKVKEDGKMTYKKTSSTAIIKAIQLGLGYSIGKLSAKPERDVLMEDFASVMKVWFPRNGSKETPAHTFNDFKFKAYAPNAFRYFRDLFGMQPGDFLMSLSNEPLTEISNPGASGSLFFLSADDTFIVKTVQHKEATFLQQLLPGYYLNLHQNARTLLPKFFGLYCYQSQNTNIRLAVMNNLLPSNFKCHQKYDLKGSTYKRKASKAELQKKSPVKKDLDYSNDHPEGIVLEAETYDAVIKTVKRDCRVLESFKIMDYSLLLGIHNVDQAVREKEENSIAGIHEGIGEEKLERIARGTEFMAALEAIQIDRAGNKDARPLGGIPAKNTKGERLIVFLGIIDILQSYRLAKKLEHGWKSMIHDGDTVSVHNPSYYASRFLNFVAKQVFQKGSPAVTRSSSKRRSSKYAQGQTPMSSTIKQRIVETAEVADRDPLPVKARTRITFADPPSTEVENDRGEQNFPPPYEDKATPAYIDKANTVSGETETTEVEQTTKTTSEQDNLSPGGDMGNQIESTSEELTTTAHGHNMKIVTITTTEEITGNDVIGDSVVTITTTEEIVEQPQKETKENDVIGENVVVMTTTEKIVEKSAKETSGNDVIGDNVVVMTTTEKIVKQTPKETPETDGICENVVVMTTTEKVVEKTAKETSQNDVKGDNVVVMTTKEEVVEQTDIDGNVITKTTKVTVSGSDGEETTVRELAHNSDSSNNTSETVEYAQKDQVSDVSYIETSLTGNDIHVVNEEILRHPVGSHTTAL